MKQKLLAIFVLLLFATFLTGCSSGPGSTVQKFFQAVDKGKVEESMGYLSSSTIQALGHEKWQAALIEMSNQMSTQGGLKSVDINEETVNGDIAQITVTVIMKDGSEDTDRMDLIKEDGDWKIQMDPWSK